MNRRTFLQLAAYSGSTLLTGCDKNHRKIKQKIVYKKNKVLILGIDGCRPDALQKAKTPSIDSLINNGAYSFNGQAGDITLTAPGWSNVFCGVWEDKHKVKNNSYKGGNYKKYPSLFTRIEESAPYLKTGSIAWEKINKNIIKNADHLINHKWSEKNHNKVLNESLPILKENIDLVFVYFMQPDNTGHAHGFSPHSTKYVESIEKVDNQIEKVLKTIKERNFYHYENWLTLLISDHGGEGKSHYNVEEAKRIPFVVSGPSVIRSCLSEKPKQIDVFPTIFHHLGIPVKKEWELEGKVVGLK